MHMVVQYHGRMPGGTAFRGPRQDVEDDGAFFG